MNCHKTIIANRAASMKLLKLEAAQLSLTKQVHGAHVMTVTEPYSLLNPPKADAQVTNKTGIALGVITADCAPILLYDNHAKIIGAVHAGWRGAYAGIIEATIGAMEKLGAIRSHIMALIGPCIYQSSYEVGPEFRESFCRADNTNTSFFAPSLLTENHYYFDLPGFITTRLKQSGLNMIEIIPKDTFTNEELFFSYRRSYKRGEIYRQNQLSVICLSNTGD